MDNNSISSLKRYSVNVIGSLSPRLFFINRFGLVRAGGYRLFAFLSLSPSHRIGDVYVTWSLYRAISAAPLCRVISFLRFAFQPGPPDWCWFSSIRRDQLTRQQLPIRRWGTFTNGWERKKKRIAPRRRRKEEWKINLFVFSHLETCTRVFSPFRWVTDTWVTKKRSFKLSRVRPPSPSRICRVQIDVIGMLVRWLDFFFFFDRRPWL